MHRKISTTFFLLSSSICFSQVPEDALKLSWFTQTGTARNQAIGGAGVSLGGDASANYINPAGLAFFKTSDFIFTPGFQFGKGKSNFRGTDYTGKSDQSGGPGTTGFVFGGFGRNARNSFGITLTRLTDFKQTTFYNGENNYSSFGEPLADELASSKLTIDQALNDPNISLQTKMSLYTYLVDTATINGSKQIISRSELVGNRSQQNRIESSGGITELTLGFGSEINKKLLAGISFGASIINNKKRTYYREADATGNNNNNFNYLAYDENYTLKGFGLNLRGGIIYRPKEYIRLGLAIHSPTWMPLKETLRSGFAADLEKLFAPNTGYDSVASSVFTNGSNSENRYVINSPAKIMIGGSYVFREEERIERQKGFITADIEYINYKWLNFAPYDLNLTSADIYKPYNDAIKALYKGVFNFRMGGELKFKTMMARAGFSYYGSPYKDSELKGRKMNISGGLGYRNKGMFIDLTYVHHLNKDINFPYRVNSPRANTFANLKNSGGNILVTLGFKI